MRIAIADGCLVRSAGPESGPALWFLHGFADSGLAFREILESDLAGGFGLFAPDLPGFGASPPQPDVGTIDRFAAVTVGLIGMLSPDRPVGLVGHSVGAVIAVEAALRLGDRCRGVVSIEGNLTADDAYFSGRAAGFDDAAAFKAMLAGLVWERSAAHPVLRRYHASVLMAAAPTMWAFGRDVARYSAGDNAGHRYRALPGPTLYCWCAGNTPRATARFIEEHDLADHRFADAGHWPMLDATEEVVAVLGEFFSTEA